MREPKPEQSVILSNTERVRVVRATPGSGKTWLVAEVIRQAIDKWPSKSSGIAALSFTRVGGDEIRKAVGYELDHPHFVGTIDAFLFRYVIRPHLCNVFAGAFAAPSIVAGDWGAVSWTKCSRNLNATAGQGIKLFGCVFIYEQDGQAVVAHKPHPSQPLRVITGDDLAKVKEAKRKIWKTCGLLTHSDAALWASKILTHPKFGSVIRSEINRRFSFLIVDELQDTGCFLAKSILALLEERPSRGLLVGDPDQAIYEFNGARPALFDLFEKIPGAVSLPLANSRRCPPSIANAAVHLKDSGGVLGPAQNQSGRAFLIPYKNMVSEARRIQELVSAKPDSGTVKIIARGNATIDEIMGRSADHPNSLHCRPLTHLARGVRQFGQGRNLSAMAAARAALECALFDHESVSEEDLKSAGIDTSEWRALIVRCLLKANDIPRNGTSYEWQETAGQILDQEISCLGLNSTVDFVPGQLKPQKRTGWDKPSANFLPSLSSNTNARGAVVAQTVHGVKGETHDTTIFVCPPVSRIDYCPSKLWWSSTDKDREEKRIAYVAMTRTRGDLIVLVSEECYARLRELRPAFVDSFECIGIADYEGIAGVEDKFAHTPQ
jgi:DNA helicase II / ATP-dependent DNA helicase PcrA